VSTRDFCNREEVRIPEYFEVVSVLDHHKASLFTTHPPTVLIADVQSANTLMTEQALTLQQRYALGDMDRKTIETQLQALEKVSSPSSMRRRGRLLKKLEALEQSRYWVSPERQWWQGVQMLFGILDDTDLLTKICWRDLEAVVALLNLLASLDGKDELESVAFDDLEPSQEALDEGRERVLACPLFSGLLHRILKAKKEAVETAIDLASKGLDSNIFEDRKIQNSCAAVGQVKLFPTNRDYFYHNQRALQSLWLKQSVELAKQRPEIDLFIEMISTLSHGDPEDPVAAQKEDQDALWIWVPPPEASRVHLRVFLANLVRGPLHSSLSKTSVTIYGPDRPGLVRLFQESFPNVHVLQQEEEERGDLAFAVIMFPEGLLNSRKATVTPCLPRIGS
jgi:hypothetical protein